MRRSKGWGLYGRSTPPTRLKEYILIYVFRISLFLLNNFLYISPHNQIQYPPLNMRDRSPRGYARDSKNTFHSAHFDQTFVRGEWESKSTEQLASWTQPEWNANHFWHSAFQWQLHQYQSGANERERPAECSFWVTAGSARLCEGDSGLWFGSVWCIGPIPIPVPIAGPQLRCQH